MRILFLCHRIPFPPDKGDKIRSYHILQNLIAGHDVYLASLIDVAKDMRHVPAVAAMVKRYMHTRIHGYKQLLLAALQAVGLRPLTVSHFYSPALQQQIDALLDEVTVDAVVCFSSPMAEYVFRSRHARGQLARAVRIMDFIDVDSYKWRQYAQRSPWWKAWIYHYEAWTLARYEQRIARQFQHLLVVSRQELSYFPAPAPVKNLQAMSNGVDLNFFSPSYVGKLPLVKPALVFTGVMDYWPNIEGVIWFVEQVLPLIRAQIPAVQFYIVGRDPARSIQRLAGLGIHITGFVDDVRDYLAQADVCVVPLRIARGIQNKVLEAMAMGRPVIATPQAFEGIDAMPGRDLVVAEQAEAFAAAIIAVLTSPQQAAELGHHARRSMEHSYSWQANLHVLDACLRQPSALNGTANR